MHEHFLAASRYADYERCGECGSLFRREWPEPESIYAEGYWDRQGHSTLEEQVYNIVKWKSPEGVTKCQSVLKHCGRGVTVLEIGCAPGIMLKRLGRRFGERWGIEYSREYTKRIRRIAGPLYLLSGAFPEVSREFIEDAQFDCVLAMDVLEHSPNGLTFVEEVRRLLRPGGRAVFMLPALFSDRRFDKRFLHPEHIAIYSQRFLREWFGEVFDAVQFDRWVVGHEIVVGRVKDASVSTVPDR